MGVALRAEKLRVIEGIVGGWHWVREEGFYCNGKGESIKLN